MSLGGALGGVFVSLIAPVAFRGYWEYPIGLIAAGAMFLLVAFIDNRRRKHDPLSSIQITFTYIGIGVGVIGLAALAVVLTLHARHDLEHTAPGGVTRNFYGVLLVEEGGEDEWSKLTLHRPHHAWVSVSGSQEKRTGRPATTAKAAASSWRIDSHPRRFAAKGQPRNLKVGVVGLGTGTIATLGQEGDFFRFYDINPKVIRLSDEFFSYRRDSTAKTEVKLGDTRVAIKRPHRQRG